jgi:hypothetical protein
VERVRFGGNGDKMKAKMNKISKQVTGSLTCKEMHKLVKTRRMSTLTVREGRLLAEHAMGCRKCRSLKSFVVK